MFEKIYLGAIIIFFLLAFAIRNIKTAINTGLAIKGKSKKVSISVLLSTLLYVLIICRLSFLGGKQILELETIGFEAVKYIGLVVVTIGFALGIAALMAMKNSWRVGIRYEQKTELVTEGIYRFSRNPYFLSYYVLMFGFLLVFPSPILFAIYLSLIFSFHSMILDEEKYLENIHGQEYLSYKKKVKRYLSLNI